MAIKNLAILKSSHYRRLKSIENVIIWAENRNVEWHKVVENDISNIDWGTIGLLYIPLNRDMYFLKDIPENIPVVLDFDGALGGVLDNFAYLQRHRFSFRRAFGGQIKYNPEFQVPYLHLPLKPNSNTRVNGEKNIIIIDTHQWLSTSWHFSLLSHLFFLAENYEKICNLLQLEIKFYLTSFMNIKPYVDASFNFIISNGKHPSLNKFPENYMNKISFNLIEPAEKVEDYYQLLFQTRLFISDHGDLADQDIVHVGSLGVPLYLIPRVPFRPSKGITFSIKESVFIIEPRFKSLLEDAEKNRIKKKYDYMSILKLEKVDCWDNEILTSAFLKSWDLLWEWATYNKINKLVNEAVQNSPNWEM
jgi:hypothetical protein